LSSSSPAARNRDVPSSTVRSLRTEDSFFKSPESSQFQEAASLLSQLARINEENITRLAVEIARVKNKALAEQKEKHHLVMVNQQQRQQLDQLRHQVSQLQSHIKTLEDEKKVDEALVAAARKYKRKREQEEPVLIEAIKKATTILATIKKASPAK
jgi:septal ring factor EnvC (AmiA/AmiB activator)